MGVGHYTEPDVYAAARVFTGWNLTRAGRRRRPQRSRVRLQRGAARHRREDVQLSDLPRTAARPFPRARRPTACRTASISSTALAAQPEHGGATWRRKLYRFFVSEFGDVDDGFVNRVAAVYLQSGYDMKRGDARGADVAAVLGRAATASRATRGRSSSSSASIKDVGWSGLLAERRADAARRTWGRTSTIRRTWPAGISGQSWFSTGVDAGAHELRVGAGRQSEVQARATAAEHACAARRSSSPACSTR